MLSSPCLWSVFQAFVLLFLVFLFFFFWGGGSGGGNNVLSGDDDDDDDNDDDDGDDVDDDEDGEDGDGGDGDDAQKMNGLLSCGQKKYNNLLAVTRVSIMTIFSPMELRLKHVKSKTVHKTQCNCVIQTTLNH